MNATTQRPRVNPRLALQALGYGAIAGLTSILTFKGMTWLQHLVWDGLGLPIYVTILLGGALLILIGWWAPTEDLETLLRHSEDPGHLPRRAVAATAFAAIVAVAFGGAIGPEAGIVAVVAQMSAIVTHLIARDVDTQRVIGQAGNAGALGGLYGSPPGAAAIDGDDLGQGKALQLAAGFAGFFVFVGVAKLTSSGEGGHIALPAIGEPQPFLLLVVAVVAAAAGLLFRGLHHAFEQVTAGIKRRWLVVAGGTVLFAALATVQPLLRFSGHHELNDLLPLIQNSQWSLLLAIAVGKVVAVALCLVSGWRGGEFFPLVFTGAAIGAALSVLLPGLDAGSAMATGMVATAAVGWKRTVAVLLILILLIDAPVALPLLIGAGVAYVFGLMVPPASSSPSPAPDSPAHPR
ncbi:hypothetical protein HCH15_08190 [Corynebacterium testudinoris]|uniref:Chloride channel protein EriC n=1 Tax=Corynebacterium testudinoris TaxID=136857 RepID=A0A0G3HCC3_9CORY|nr:chloride channel protein [Corynebacterium testudinoris]AKK09598.1 chloride channel protein EriC [Corynebacterium testudinoris]MBX8996158.1 hypothetical protein [Corynebacterium testudinoris]